MGFQFGNKFGKGRPRLGEGRTADLKSAQRKLQQLLDAELSKNCVDVQNATAVVSPEKMTKAEKIIFELVADAIAGKLAAIEIVLERWAGKPAMVEVEKAYVEPVSVTIEHVGSNPRSEFEIDPSADKTATKAN